MFNDRFICVYDFETTGVDPNVCLPIQVCAKILNPISLQVVDGGEFSTFIKNDIPEESLTWHINKRKISKEAFLEKINSSPSEEQVWKDFAKFLKRFHRANTKRQSMHTAPIRAGANIVGYDNIIWDRLCKKYGFWDEKQKRQNIAFARDNLDIQPMLWFWFEGYADPPENLSMDTLCPYFGLDRALAHDAASDVDDTIHILTSYMKLFRKVGRELKKGFKGALA